MEQRRKQGRNKGETRVKNKEKNVKQGWGEKEGGGRREEREGERGEGRREGEKRKGEKREWKKRVWEKRKGEKKGGEKR